MEGYYQYGVGFVNENDEVILVKRFNKSFAYLNNTNSATRFFSLSANNNTITNISVKNDMGGWQHPEYKTDNLLNWLRHYNQKALNNVTIKDLRTPGSDQQHAFY